MISKKVKEAVQFYRMVGKNKFTRQRSDYLQNVGIFGFARGGTTWLAELLKSIPSSTLVWEPLFRYRQYQWNWLNPFAYPEQKIKGFDWNQHIPQDAEWPEAEEFFAKLLNRQIQNLKLLRFNDLKKVNIREDVFIYKFCFGNLLLPWLMDHFDLKAIVLVRHPAAVVSSSLKFGENFHWHRENPKVSINNHQKYNPEFLKRYHDAAQIVNSAEAHLAFQWAVQYDYLINHPYNNLKWLTVSYEKLYLHPEEEVNRIFNYLDFQVPENTWDKLKKVSFSSSSDHSKDAIKSGNQLEGWKRNLTKKQVSNIFQVLNAIGIDFYTENAVPDYKKLYKL